jgi:hypothetical protein
MKLCSHPTPRMKSACAAALPEFWEGDATRTALLRGHDDSQRQRD